MLTICNSTNKEEQRGFWGVNLFNAGDTPEMQPPDVLGREDLSGLNRLRSDVCSRCLGSFLTAYVRNPVPCPLPLAASNDHFGWDTNFCLLKHKGVRSLLRSPFLWILATSQQAAHGSFSSLHPFEGKQATIDLPLSLSCLFHTCVYIYIYI